MYAIHHNENQIDYNPINTERPFLGRFFCFYLLVNFYFRLKILKIQVFALIKLRLCALLEKQKKAGNQESCLVAL